MQTSVGTSIVRGSRTTARNSVLEIPTPENPVLDVAVGDGTGYIDTFATVRLSNPKLRRTNGCTADRDLAVLKW
jgi:hypothetical protein